MVSIFFIQYVQKVPYCKFKICLPYIDQNSLILKLVQLSPRNSGINRWSILQIRKRGSRSLSNILAELQKEKSYPIFIALLSQKDSFLSFIKKVLMRVLDWKSVLVSISQQTHLLDIGEGSIVSGEKAQCSKSRETKSRRREDTCTKTERSRGM